MKKERKKYEIFAKYSKRRQEKRGERIKEMKGEQIYRRKHN